MPSPTQQYTTEDEYNAAYEYNYLYDYPIGNVPMYFPIRAGGYPELPKKIYINMPQEPKTPIRTENDFTVYYVIFIVLAIFVIVLLKA